MNISDELPLAPLPSGDSLNGPANAGGAGASADNQQVQGRSVFAVETTALGVAVRTVFLANDGRMAFIPVVFPTLDYALEQIDEMRRLVQAHFAQAAQVGAQVIAAQAAQQAAPTENPSAA